MKISKIELARKISQLKGIVPKKTTINALQGILVQDGYLIASNTELTVKATLEGIHEIAEKCKTIPIVSSTQKQAEEYAEGITAEQVYMDMLVKIVEAPTKIHMRLTTRMLIPIISDKLKERGMR